MVFGVSVSVRAPYRITGSGPVKVVEWHLANELSSTKDFRSRRKSVLCLNKSGRGKLVLPDRIELSTSPLPRAHVVRAKLLH